jgi:hypothetical protein
MSALSKTAFLSKWAGLFADNTSRDISEEDIRDFRQDIADSFLNIVDRVVTNTVVLMSSYNASTNLFPAAGTGSASDGAIKKGDLYPIGTGGTLGGDTYAVGDLVLALTDAPGQTAGNWLGFRFGSVLGYTPEDAANKATDFSTLNNDLYPSVQAVENRVLAALAGLQWKNSVRVATTTAGTLATSFENGDTVDGVVLATGNRILIKDQVTQTENGIYVVVASGAPTRATDADSGAELESATVTVQEGTSNANTSWTQTTDSVTVGSSNIIWAQVGSSSPNASESTPGIIEIATHGEVTTGTDDQRAITPLKLATAVPAASESAAGKAEVATSAEVTTGTDDARMVTPLKLAGATRGVQDLFISAAAMWARTTNGCAALAKTEMATSLFNIQTLDFDQTTQEFAQFQIAIPRKWNNGTVTAVFYWTAAAGSGDVQWGISGGAYSNDDALTVALGSAQTSDDTLIATNDLHISPATSAITLAGTPADADFLAFQISRNPASDTLSADAKLLGVSIRLTTESAIDA